MLANANFVNVESLMMNYQPNQIYRSHEGTHYLVVDVRFKDLTLLDLLRQSYVNPMYDSPWLEYFTFIGTADSHPEFLI
jgi:hypothetical protein